MANNGRVVEPLDGNSRTRSVTSKRKNLIRKIVYEKMKFPGELIANRISRD